MEKPLVSIIIPTYNRAHLIGETLDSVLAQTYTNWECIVVDDGSTDHTDEVLKTYCDKDARFKYVHRPNTHKPGGNGARNYGFEVSKGEYVNWFDSDDLMVGNFLTTKLKAILSTNLDFVFSKTINFLENGLEIPLFENDNKDKLVTAENFILGTLTWCTPDFLAKKACLNEIHFNESLKSGQEYNFFVKVLTATNRGVYIDSVLTKRRIHGDSIQEIQRLDSAKYRLNKYSVYLITYKDIYLNPNSAKIALDQLIKKAMSKAFDITLHNEELLQFKFLIKSVLLQKGLYKVSLFLLSIGCALFFKKGYILMNYSRQ